MGREVVIAITDSKLDFGPWEEREGVKLEDCLYRGLMRRGAGDELAAGCAESDIPLCSTSYNVRFNPRP